MTDGRALRAYDSGAAGVPDGPAPADAGHDLVAVWCHGTPNLGMPPEPLMTVARELRLRWVGYDRPGYGGSDPLPGRTVADAGHDVAAVLDALGAERCLVVGHSGGGPHALAAAAALPDRVAAAVVVSSLAPHDAPGLDWFAGMSATGQEVLTAAEHGRAARLAHVERADAEPIFVQRDLDALAGPWSWFMDVVEPALAGDPAGAADDDVAYVTPWGFAPDAVVQPVLVVHGGADLVAPASHARWLAARLPRAELWVEADDGHVSVLRRADDALRWAARAAGVLPGAPARS
ncbi:alpha/beta fold hydrolase [Cellulomonas massiliensis]|uniref:alpha/beta fold hydrolase n=1 Tax=Cellulomonas massiliensis TaxID=1465811 RepID=UPI00058C0028|nr:alpha/beta fold hydrolase [Cellulomonas massiliensis]